MYQPEASTYILAGLKPLQRTVWQKFISELFVNFESLSVYSTVDGNIILHTDTVDHINTSNVRGNTNNKTVLIKLSEWTQIYFSTTSIGSNIASGCSTDQRCYNIC